MTLICFDVFLFFYKFTPTDKLVLNIIPIIECHHLYYKVMALYSRA